MFYYYLRLVDPVLFMGCLCTRPPWFHSGWCLNDSGWVRNARSFFSSRPQGDLCSVALWLVTERIPVIASCLPAVGILTGKTCPAQQLDQIYWCWQQITTLMSWSFYLATALRVSNLIDMFFLNDAAQCDVDLGAGHNVDQAFWLSHCICYCLR